MLGKLTGHHYNHHYNNDTKCYVEIDSLAKVNDTQFPSENSEYISTAATGTYIINTITLYQISNILILISNPKVQCKPYSGNPKPKPLVGIIQIRNSNLSSLSSY